MMKKILIVDDNPDHLGLLEYALYKAGFCAPETVKNGTEALKAASENDFDLMMVDIRLPDMSGFKVIMSVRKMSRHKKTKIIAMSADPQIAEEKWQEIGADEIIILPSLLSNYVKTIKSLLDK